MRIRYRTQIWPACVKFHVADHTQFKFLFSAGCVTVYTIISTIGSCAQSDSKMGTEVVGTLTHADAPQRGNASHPAYVFHALH
jgi:hypothetical protein